MKQDTINWDDVPEVINKDQFYKLAKVSKSTARFLLKSGKVPCIYSEKKTRCYKIKKRDVIAFIEDREKYPEFYKASRGWYSNNGRMDDEADTYRFVGVCFLYDQKMLLCEICAI